MNEGIVVELDGLEKSFRTPAGVVEAVCGVDISVRAGEVVALLGPNGEVRMVLREHLGLRER